MHSTECDTKINPVFKLYAVIIYFFLSFIIIVCNCQASIKETSLLAQSLASIQYRYFYAILGVSWIIDFHN